MESQQQSCTQIDCKDHDDLLDLPQNDVFKSKSLPQLKTDTIHNLDCVKDQFRNNSKKEKASNISTWTLLRLNKPEWKYITLGVIGSVIMGLSGPIYGIIFGEVLGLLDLSQQDVQHLNNMYTLVTYIE